MYLTLQDFEIFIHSEQSGDKDRSGDHAAYQELNSGGLLALAVADGVGSHQCDWAASEIACKTTLDVLASASEDIEERIRQSVLASHSDIQDLRGEARGAQSTLVLTVVDPISGDFNLVSIGDSRAYLVSGDSVEQLTRDDAGSVIVRRDGAPVLEAGAVKQRRGVTNILGASETPVITLQSGTLAAGDTLALVTDGCCELAGFERNLLAVHERVDLERAVRSLVFSNFTGSGQDDATLLLLRGTALPTAMTGEYEAAIKKGKDFREKGLQAHLMARLAVKLAAKGLAVGEAQLLGQCLDYLERFRLFPGYQDLVELLDAFPQEGDQEMTRQFRRLTRLAGRVR